MSDYYRYGIGDYITIKIVKILYNSSSCYRTPIEQKLPYFYGGTF